jgi:hypothetical protein
MLGSDEESDLAIEKTMKNYTYDKLRSKTRFGNQPLK